jgi:protease-4
MSAVLADLRNLFNNIAKVLKNKVMKQFFKFTFASMLGCLLSFVIFLLIAFVFISLVLSLSKPEKVALQEKSLLRFTLDQAVSDRAPKDPLLFFDMMNMRVRSGPGLDDILEILETAKTDSRIQGVMLDLGYIPSGISMVEEIRNALLDFKTSGKAIYAYAEVYSQKAYYLASVADRIFIHPEGGVDFRGFSGEILFIKGLLDKLEVEAQVIRHGKYKSAVEPFMLDKMSEANREQTLACLSSIWSHVVDQISAQRKITPEELNRIADSLLLKDAAAALAYRFVDSIVYHDQVNDFLARKMGLAKIREKNFVSPLAYKAARAGDKQASKSRNKIAVVYALGSISGGEGDDASIGSERISKALRKAREDESIKAIVFRVNSPGGSALASDVIWREVDLARQTKPVVVSMGDVAGSGGYYISCAASRILADPTTITGSIGVLGVVPNFEKFFRNKLGITFDGVSTNPNADYISINHSLTDYQKKILEYDIERIYKVFVQHVADGRNMTVAEVDSIGQGRIWSGVDAVNVGLVDELGGLNDAIRVAGDLAGIREYRIISLPVQKDALTQLLEDFQGTTLQSSIKKQLGEGYKYYKLLEEISRLKGIQARMPCEIIIE